MNAFIRRYDDEFHWFVTSDEAVVPEVLRGSLSELAGYCKSHEHIRNWVLIAPALDLASRTLHFSAKEKKHIQKAMPYLLEETLLTEADELFYVSDKPANDHVDVVALDESKLQGWLDELEQAGVRVNYCLPELKLLAADEADWLLYYRQGEFILQADHQCAAFEAEHLPLSLELLSENFSKLPQSIHLLADSDEALAQALGSIPEALQHLLHTEILPYAKLLQQGFSRGSRIWNLLRGKFARSQEWQRLVKPWRWVIISLLLVLLLQVGMMAVETAQYKKRQQVLQTQMDSLIRQVIPRGNIVDHRKQLERELRKLEGGGSSAGFAEMINSTGAVLAKHQIQSLNSLTYEQEKNELRLDLLVDNYDKLQAIMADMKAASINVEIQNSNAQGDQLRARLRVGG